MGPAERERLVNHFHQDEPSVIPAVLSCVAGIFGLIIVASSPWLLVTSPAPGRDSEQPAVQAARVSPAIEESRRVFEERRQRLEAVQGGTQSAAASPATSVGAPN